LATKRTWLGPQNSSTSSGGQFLGQGDEVKVRPEDDRELMKGYVVSIQNENDRSISYVVRTKNDEVLTVEPDRVEAVKSESTGQWSEI